MSSTALKISEAGVAYVLAPEASSPIEGAL
jgi:hypothetical protein